MIAKRLRILAGGQSSIEASDDNRIALYERSLLAFIQSPIWGRMLGADTSVSGHSQIFDALGNYGIIGAIVILAMYKRIYKAFYSPLKNLPGYGYVFCMFCEAIVLSSVNSGFYYDVLAFYAPLLCIAINNRRNQKMLAL